MSKDGGAPGRPPATIQAEAEAARSEFQRAVAAGEAPAAAPASAVRRSAALQAFFAANAGRSLLPSSETSGTVSPHLKPEEP